MSDSANPFAQFSPAPVAANPFAQFAPSAAPAAPVLDKYQQAAADELAKLKGTPADPSYSVPESFFNGAMMGALPTVMAGLTTPFEMIKRGTLDPTDGYAYAKAAENAAKEAGDAAHPWLNTAANLAGGVGTGSTLARAGATFVPQVVAGQAAPGLLRTAAGMAADGGSYGALTGFNSGEGSGRITGALEGGTVGALTGAALPIGVHALTGNPIVSQISARLNPEGFASSQLARALMESGKTPEELQAGLDAATSANQPNYALADALGHSGQRMLTTVTKSPGPGRQAAVDFLDARQAGQSGEVSSALAEALGAPKTAAQVSAGLTSERAADAAANYGAARGSAGAVDVSPAVQAIDSNLTPGVNAVVSPMADLAALPIDGKLQWIRDRLASSTSQLSDFDRVFGVKRQVDSMIGVATRQGDGATVSVLTPIRQQLDDQLAAASKPYAAARDAYRTQSQGIEAVPMGTAAASGRVRAPDAIGQFGGLDPAAQQPFRAGFADPVIAKAESGAFTANAARPLLNTTMQNKLDAFATSPLSAQKLRESLQRSDAMFQTRAKALGNSATVENANDQHASGIDPSALWDAASEGIPGLIRGAVRVGSNFLGGSTPAVRSALGDALLMHGPGADVAGRLAPAIKAQIQRAALARAIAGGLLGGGAAGASNQIETSPNGRH